MFEYTFGDIGSGKSLTMAKKVQSCLREAVLNAKKWNIPVRELWANLDIAEDYFVKYTHLKHWCELLPMIYVDYPNCTIPRRDFDCFIDELAEYLSSDKWKECDKRIRRFFRNHRRRGVRIYGNTQDYMMLDIYARRMATRIFKTRKLIGSPDPSPTLPPIKHVWGLIITRELDKKSVEKDTLMAQTIGLPSPTLISKNLTDFYNTRAETESFEEPELLHRVKICKICGLKKIIHE